MDTIQPCWTCPFVTKTPLPPFFTLLVCLSTVKPNVSCIACILCSYNSVDASPDDLGNLSNWSKGPKACFPQHCQGLFCLNQPMEQVEGNWNVELHSDSRFIICIEKLQLTSPLITVLTWIVAVLSLVVFVRSWPGEEEITLCWNHNYMILTRTWEFGSSPR